MDSPIVQEGDHVVFRRAGSARVFQIRKKRQVYFEKSKFSVDELIGQPYGSIFRIDRGKLIKVEPAETVTSNVQLEGTVALPGADNRNLLDTEANQKMSKDDIMKMKVDGIAGEEIIETLIENSETFKTKTVFSQAKYLKKKKQKHMLIFTVLRPTPRLIMEIFSKEPAKICYLRPDTLSQLLNYSNVMCGSRIAVVETCQGLVLSCLLQRMGGQGKLIQLIPNANNAVCRHVVDYFSFPKECMDNVYTFPLDRLSSLTEESSRPLDLSSHAPEISKDVSAAVEQKCPLISSATDSQVDSGGGDNVEGSNVKQESDSTKDVEMVKDEDAAQGDSTIPLPEADDRANGDQAAQVGDKRPFAPNREKQRKERELRQKEAGNMIKQKQLDSLILACKYNPTPILMKMMNFLPPSRPVVVFCQFMEPLVECYNQIKEKHLGLQLRLSETWYREYQVLPERTHPMMNMSGTGGYLLTFMSSQPSDPVKLP